MDEQMKRNLTKTLIVLVFMSIFISIGYKIRGSQIEEIINAKNHFVESLKTCYSDLDFEKKYGKRMTKALRDHHNSYVCRLRNLSYKEEGVYGSCCKKINGTELCVDSEGVEFNYPISVDFNNFENIRNATVKIETTFLLKDEDYDEIEVTIKGFYGHRCRISNAYTEENNAKISCW